MPTRLLLHICCGPCSTHVFEVLKKDFQVTGFFYNPNIWPEAEWQKRLKAVENFSKERFRAVTTDNEMRPKMSFPWKRASRFRIPPRRVMAGKSGMTENKLNYKKEHQKFLNLVKGLENEPEGGKHCQICYKMRLERTAQLAKENNFEWFATTLTIGRNKKAEVINRIGQEVAARYSITSEVPAGMLSAKPMADRKQSLKFFEADFKKQDGFKHSVELSKNLGLYRQDYCGCEFSVRSLTGFEKWSKMI